MNLLRSIPSLKLKFGLVIVGAIGIATVFSQIGFRLGWPIWLRPIVSMLVSLVFVQFIAKGMTSPLRQMERAVDRMAHGDYRHRVETDSVDEVGRLADSFNVMSAELSKIETERRDLVMNVSHELRTPLAALRAQLENMIDGVTQPTPDQLDATLAQSLRLEALIGRLMELARIESGQTSLRLAPTNVTDLLLSAVAEAELRSPTADFELDSPLDLKTDLDDTLMMQVLANLLDNAARHAAAGTAVRVEARTRGDGIRIEVLDAGPGLEPEDASRIFERFWRADTDRSSSSGGAGLGLSIARGIVELHGGTIAAEANQPHGLRIVIDL